MEIEINTGKLCVSVFVKILPLTSKLKVLALKIFLLNS